MTEWNESHLSKIFAELITPPRFAKEFVLRPDGSFRWVPIDGYNGEDSFEYVAEYNGMIAGVRKAIELDPHAVLRIRLDSKLVVEQMSGRWKIKHPDMADLAAEARRILSGTPVSFEWIPREQNSRADRLANEAMDKRMSFAR